MVYALGRHVLLELHGCPDNLLSDVTAIENHMIEAANQAGATVINTTFHHFAPAGVSGVVVIQESHLAIHTWPEHHFASIDIFTCGTNVDPWRSVTHLKRALQATGGKAHEIPRGQTEIQPKQFKAPQTPNIPIQHNLWFTERNENLALSLRHTGVVYQKQSAFQKIEIFKTAGYGNMLVLDGQIMCTEKDECIYHEMIAHIPALTHPNPHNALVIGGGDGGAVRELLRHDSINHIDLIEIDEEVIKAAQQYLPALSQKLKDPRVTLKIGNGVEVISQIEKETYDLILIDIPGVDALQSPSFYRAIFEALKPNGLMVTQIPPPILFEEDFPKTTQAQRMVFGQTHPYFAFIPTYATGMLSFSFASKNNIDPRQNLDLNRINNFVAKQELQYYTADIHTACFAIPPLVQTRLTDERTI